MNSRFVFFVLAVLFAGNAYADPKETASEIDQAVKTWMAKKLVASAAAAVAFDGSIVASYGYGGWTPDADYPVASLSKAITGVCVAKLIDEGKLALGDTVGKVLDTYLKSHLAPADPRMLNVSVEDLLIHRSGLQKNTFGNAHSVTAAVQNTLASSLADDPGTVFSYSDSGYLLVGYMADQASSHGYYDTCSPILGAVGANGMIDKTMNERAPNGGWDISANNYAKFLSYFLKDSTRLSPKMMAFLRTPPYGGYSLGAFVKPSKIGTLLTHTGLVHHDQTHPETGGSYYIVTDSGYVVVVIFSGENPGGVYGALDAAVTKILLATNDKATPPTPPTVPQPAQKTAEAFAADIDGKPWVANSITTVYTEIGGKPVFNLAARRMSAPESFFNFNLYLPAGFMYGSVKIEAGKPLGVSHGNFDSDVPSGDILHKDYTFQSGTIVIEHYDAAAKTIFGTFSGVIKNHSGDKVLQVTNGKFSGIPYDPVKLK